MSYNLHNDSLSDRFIHETGRDRCNACAIDTRVATIDYRYRYRPIRDSWRRDLEIQTRDAVDTITQTSNGSEMGNFQLIDKK